MDLGTIILILVVLAPLIEKIFTGAKTPPQPPPRRTPAPRPDRQRAPYDTPQSSGPKPPARSQEQGNASEMLPDELWELLTGEKRKPRVPEPPLELPKLPPRTKQPSRATLPAPAPRRTPPLQHLPESTLSYDEEARDEEVLATREQQPSRELSIPPRPRTSMYEPFHRPPEIVSLEDNIPTDEERHLSFHDRLMQLPAAASIQRTELPLAAELRDREAVRRAFIMTEILGTPKGLE